MERIYSFRIRSFSSVQGKNMFTLAILLGIFCYGIFALGLLGILYKGIVIIYTCLFLAVIFLILCIKNKLNFRKWILEYRFSGARLSLILLTLFVLQVIVNFIGVLGPETAFDALWYHLTLPKIYLIHHKIFYIPGGLLYYSAMPKFFEMLYIPALALNGEVLAKVIHFTSGIFISIALFQFSKEKLGKTLSILVTTVFYSNLVVGWESITAVIDLGRTFFEFMALWAFILWVENKKIKWFYLSSLLLGLAISSKLLAFSSLIIFLILISIHLKKQRESVWNIFITILKFSMVSLLIVSPWFLFSYSYTGNMVYPFFSSLYPIIPNNQLFNPVVFFDSIRRMFLYLSDPINPIYIISFPLSFFIWKKMDYQEKIIGFYSLLAVLIWYATPRTGGGRFIVPYLPAFSILVGITIKKLMNYNIKRVLIVILIVISVINVVYRGIANAKYIPVIIGEQSKSEFLTKYLNFSFGDFYDTDNFFKSTISKNDIVLLYGFHNLYYVDFPFIDSSFVKNGDRFNYIAVQNSELPKRFKNWTQIYYNSKTFVKLYTLNGQKWIY